MRWLSVVIVIGLAACQRAKPAPIEKAPPEPAVDLVGPVGIPACDDYLRRIAACASLTPAARAAFAPGNGVWKQAAKGDSAKAATESCEHARDLASPELARLGC